MPGVQIAGNGQALDQSLPTIITGFKVLRDYDGVMRRLADPLTMQPHTGSTHEILNYGRVAAYVVAEGVDIAQAQDLSDARTSITPDEVAVQVILAGSTMRRVADPALLRRTGEIMENAYNLKEDADGCTQLDSFTTAIGSAGTIAGAGSISAAVTSLGTGNNTATPEPAPDPIQAVFHPCSLHAIMGRLQPLTDVPTGTNVYAPPSTAGATVAAGRGTAMADDIAKRGLKAMGMLAGIRVYMDANISVDASADAKSGVFSREGLKYLSEVPPHLDTEKDASLRDGIELNYWGAYGWQVYRAGAYGIECLFDATLPSA